MGVLTGTSCSQWIELLERVPTAPAASDEGRFWRSLARRKPKIKLTVSSAEPLPLGPQD